ncbi:MAG: DHHA1 domain-containing protein, partial [Acidimicrobiales bacterium]
IFLDVTPFYAEGGGQVGDTGQIETDTGAAQVLDTSAALPGLHRHLAKVVRGELVEGQVATAAVDAERRQAIRRNHTGTHLLHWALRKVLGEHVKQHGSLVAPDRLRFDFSHYGPLTPEQKELVEDLVNAAVLADQDVEVSEMARAEADRAGAIAFFEEKYGDHVRVVFAGDRSVELCGGTHVSRLGQIGPVEITSEGSIGSNLRRVEATTGTATLARQRRRLHLTEDAAALLRASPDELSGAIERKLADLRAAEDRARSLQTAMLSAAARELAASAEGGVLVARRDGLSQDQLRELAAQVAGMDGLRTVVLGGSPDGSRVALVALVPGGHGVPAPELIADAARTVGGGGGGNRPDLAVAGGRDASRIDEALDQVRARLGLAR